MDMQQSDYCLSKSESGCSMCTYNLETLLWQMCYYYGSISCVKKLRNAKLDSLMISNRSLQMSMLRFDLNLFTEKESLRDLRFLRRVITIISELSDWVASKTEK